MERSGSIGSDSGLSSRSDADVLLENRLSGLIRDAGRLFAASDHAGALQALEEVKQLHGDDGGIGRLVALFRQVLKLDRAYRCLDMASGAPTGDSASCSSSVENVRAVGGNPAAASFESWVQVLRTQFGKLSDVPTVSPGFVERVGSDAESYVEVLGCLAAVHQAVRFAACERFLAPAAVIRRLRSVQSEASTKAQANLLLAVPLQRLAMEAELLGCLLAADYKTSLLKGMDAFVHLTRAEEILAQFVNAPQQVRSSSPGSLSSRTPASLRASGSTAPATRKAMSSAALDLDHWYSLLYSHCVGRLLLLCGAGLTAAAALGPKQIAEPRAGGAGPLSLQGISCRGGMTGLLPSDIVPSSYRQELTRLAAVPGVVFVGLFANARQLPHLQDWHRSMASPGSSAGASVVAPFQDAAWLLMSPERGEHGGAAAVADGEYEWWALAFAAERQEDLPASEAERSVVSRGAEAIEAFRYRSEWRSLRMALSKACAERHAPRCVTPRSPSSAPKTPPIRPAAPTPRASVAGSTTSASTSVFRARNYVEPKRRQSWASSFWPPPCVNAETLSPFQLPSAAVSTSSLPCCTGMQPTPVSGTAGDDAYSVASESLLGHAVDMPEAPRISPAEHTRNSTSKTATATTSGTGTSSGGGTAGMSGPGHAGRVSSGTDADSSHIRCLVMPLDIGMFQAPLFLGLVEKEVPATLGTAAPLLGSVVSHRCMRARTSSSERSGLEIGNAGNTSAGAAGNAGASETTGRRGSGELASSRSNSGTNALAENRGPAWMQPLKRWCAKVFKPDGSAGLTDEYGPSVIERELKAVAESISGRRLRSWPSRSRRDSNASSSSA